MGQYFALLWLIVQATGAFRLTDAVTAPIGFILHFWQIQKIATYYGGIIVPHYHLSAAKLSNYFYPCKFFSRKLYYMYQINSIIQNERAPMPLVTFLLCRKHRSYLGRDRPTLHRRPERDSKQEVKQSGVAFIPQLKQWVFPLLNS